MFNVTSFVPGLNYSKNVFFYKTTDYGLNTMNKLQLERT